MTEQEEEELLKILSFMKSFVSFLGVIAKTAKWLTTILMFASVIWAMLFAFLNGGAPVLPH